MLGIIFMMQLIEMFACVCVCVCAEGGGSNVEKQIP
jgi:hypothetical protein